MKWILPFCVGILSSCGGIHPNLFNPLNYFSQQASTWNIEITDEQLKDTEKINISFTPRGASYAKHKLSDFPINEQKQIIQLIKAMRADYHKNIGKVDFIVWSHEINRQYVKIRIDNVNIDMGNEYFTVQDISRKDYRIYQRKIRPAEAKLRDACIQYGIKKMQQEDTPHTNSLLMLINDMQVNG